MNRLKKCPQCGTNFEGRSNKMYCSDKCKMASFKDGKNMDMLPPKEEVQPTIVAKPIAPVLQTQNLLPKDNTKELSLQVELRRLELSHIRAMAEMEAEEKDRDFELHKIQLQYEKDMRQLTREIADLKRQKEEEKKEAEKREEEKKIAQEENAINVLPKLLQQEYAEIVSQFLDSEDIKLSIPQIEAYKKELMIVMKRIAHHLKQNNWEKEDSVAYEQLDNILSVLNQMIDKIEQKGLFDSKVTAYTLSDDWREELEESIEE